MVGKIILFKPSEDFVKALFAYHKTRKKVKRKNLSPELISSIQEQIGYTLRRVLITFAYRMLLERSGEKKNDNFASIAMIIDVSGSRFENGFDKMLKIRLGIESDPFGEGTEIIYKLKSEIQEWLRGLGGTLMAENKSWPYLFLTLLANRGVSMDLNKNTKLNQPRVN